MSQKILLQIVKKWKISKKPEYRGFRCANCQKYIHKAWHYWLNEGGYKIPVHFCNKCKAKLKFKNRVDYKTFTCDNCGKRYIKLGTFGLKRMEYFRKPIFARNAVKERA